MSEEVFFKGEKLNPEIVTRDSDYSLSQENIKATKYSESTVKDDELLYRQICSPYHYNESTGEINSSAFRDAFTRGLSVNRLSLTSKKEIKEMAEKQVDFKNKKNQDEDKEEIKFQGCTYVKAEDIRKIVYEKTTKRHYAIYDTAGKINTSHADVYNIVPDLSGGEIKKAQKNLKKIFSNLEKSDSCE